MRMMSRGLGLALILAVGGNVGLACGDKLLAVGRGIRFQHNAAARQANVLIYAPGFPSGPKGEKLQGALTRGVHALQLVKDAAQLDVALRSGRVDVVLVDLASVNAVRGLLHSAPSKPAIVPILINSSKADVATAKKDYGVLLKAGADDSDYLIAIDEAMRSKVKSAGKV